MGSLACHPTGLLTKCHDPVPRRFVGVGKRARGGRSRGGLLLLLLLAFFPQFSYTSQLGRGVLLLLLLLLVFFLCFRHLTTATLFPANSF